MSSRDILVQFLSKNQLTDRLSFSDFEEVVNKGSERGRSGTPSEEQVRQWYAACQAHDEERLKALKSRVEKFLVRIEQSEMRKLETVQLQESLSLEEVVDDMYSVDQILDAKLRTLNRSIEEDTIALTRLNEILMKANRSTVDYEETNRELSTLREYRQILGNNE